MRSYPEGESDQKELKVLNAKDWQVDLLKLNPNYVHWGCFEDYMSEKERGWSSRVITSTWKGFEFGLDKLNECVNFYFQLYRKNHECPHCETTNYNPQTKQISDDWYDFAHKGTKWSRNISDVEVEALMKAGRISDVSKFHGYYDEETNKWWKFENRQKIECEKPEFPSANSVNEWSKTRFGHDAINKWICVEARAKHLGVFGHCDKCEGGYIYDEPEGKVALQLWILHPRKGCSRGVYIEEIKEDDLPEVFKYLKEAADRNQNRFSKVIQQINVTV